jgi:hypothetical protein
MKKALTIIGIVLVVLLIAGAVWFIFVRKTASTPAVSTSSGSPFGVTPSDITPSGGSGNTQTQAPVVGSGQGTPTASLFQIATDPVAGAGSFLRNKAEFIRYVDRATGHIFEVDPVAFTKTEIANNTSPKIYQAFWKPDGSTVIERTLPNDGDVAFTTSIVLTAPKTTLASTTTQASTDYTLSATQLRGDVSVLSLSTNSIAYVLADTGEVGVSGYQGQKPESLFTSAFNNWQIAWQGSNLTLTTNASTEAQGFAYLLSPSGHMKTLLGPLTALASLISPDGAHIIYSYQDENGPELAVKNLKTGVSTNILPYTLADKCVWSVKNKSLVYCATPTNGLAKGDPDDWYLGETHYSDNIWAFNVDTGQNTLLVEPKKNFSVDLDVINPELSPNEDYLIFMNKTDLSLWALKLGQS